MAYTKKQTQSIVIMGVVLVLFVGKVVLQRWSDNRELARCADTTQHLEVLRSSVKEYLSLHGNWPAALIDLSLQTSNASSVRGVVSLSDGWGRPFHYWAPTNGAGTIVSLGRDGLPGGSEFDADLKVSFP